MAERHYRSSYEPRELTDTEREIDSRVSNFLTSTPIDIHAGATLRQGYDWMREDMAMRSEMANQLAKAQAMSYEQSARGEMDRQARQQNDWDSETVNNLNGIRDSLANGSAKNWDHAVSQHIEKNPGLILNPRFMEAAKAGKGAYKSDMEAENDTLKTEITNLMGLASKGELETGQAWLRANPEAAEKIYALNKEAELAGAQESSFSKQINSMKRGMEFDDAQEALANHKKFGNDPNSERASIIAARSFKKSGLKINDPQGVMERFKDSEIVAPMLADHGWLNHTLKDEGEKQAFEQAVNDYMDEKADPTYRKAALNKIHEMAGQYEEDNKDHLLRVAGNKKLVERYGKAGQDLIDLGKDITTALTKKGANTDDGQLASDLYGKTEGMLSGIGSMLGKTVKMDTPVGKSTVQKKLDELNTLLKGVKGEDGKVDLGGSVNVIRGILNDTRSLLDSVNPDPVSELPPWQKAPKPIGSTPDSVGAPEAGAKPAPDPKARAAYAQAKRQQRQDVVAGLESKYDFTK